MKLFGTLLLVGALAALILHPVSAPVNNPIGKSLLRAEGGAPAPPFPGGGVLIAEGGAPAPPFPGGNLAV